MRLRRGGAHQRSGKAASSHRFACGGAAGDGIPPVWEYRLYAGVCGNCGHCHEAVLPLGVSPRVAGPRLLATIGALSGGYRLSKRLVQSLLQGLFGIA